MSATKPRVVVTDWNFKDLSMENDLLKSKGIEMVSGQCSTEVELVALVSDADAVITQFAKINGNVIGAMKKARAIVRYGIGVDNVNLEAAQSRNIPVCNVPDYCMDEVADQTLAFILAMTRQVVQNTLYLREGNWGLPVPLIAMQSLKNLTVGVIGFGRIGREVVRRLLAFKCRVLLFDPVVPAAEIAKAGAEPAASLEMLFAQSDIVTPHCPSTAKTRHMFNAGTFALMKLGALLVNVGRGDLVDSNALASALQSGRLGGAALDVFDPEPIPANSPILKMPNVILAAHIASVSPMAMKRLRETAASIAALAVQGQPLPNIVNGVISRA
ncbi:MAG TPA: C-terminal binding protein [Chthoniobacterales bacterium]|jgi:D-3-phosphoglycerate dehydrogenase